MDKKKLGLINKNKLELRKTVGSGTVKQSFSHGRVKSVAVEVKKVRTFAKNDSIKDEPAKETTISNPENKFLEKCKKSKVDGLIVVDLPYPENRNFAKKCKKKKINFIQLISPTTSQIRLKKIVKDSHDMIYYISMLSTTGGKLKVSPKKILGEYDKIKKQNKSKHVVIGFGITEKTIKSLKKADGLVVGSVICKEISKSIEKRQNVVTNVTNVVKRLKNKIL